MELINNRYRVLKIISQNYYVTRYLVSDVLRKHYLLCFNVFNKDNVKGNTINFLDDEFIRLKTSNNKGIVNIYEYGIIDTIDSNFVRDEIHYYISEYIDNTMAVSQEILNMEVEKRLDLFAGICAVLNTLYLRGFTYDDIRFDDLYLIKNKDDYEVKLRDIVSICLTKALNKKTAVTKKGTSNPEKTFVYPLGLLFVRLFQDCISNSGNKHISEAADIILGMKQGSFIKDIFQLIAFINKEFDKNYESFFINELEKLNFSYKIVGRKREKGQILKDLETVLNNKNKTKVIGVHGETGSGKTRLLNEIVHIIKMNKLSVFYDINFSNDGETRKTSLSIINQMMSKLEGDIAEKYELEFSSIIPSIFTDPKASLENMLIGKKDKYKLINRILGLINEITKEQPIFIVLDNMESIEYIYMDIIYYILAEESLNVMILFSYNDSTSFCSDRFSEFYNNLKSTEGYTDIKLNPLNQEETSEMVKSILSMPFTPAEIGKRIHSFTYGNSLFIEEVVKNLFLMKEIYIDKDKGVWTTDHDHIKEMPIPMNIEQAISNQMENIHGVSKELLIIMSLFNEAVELDILSKAANIEQLIVSECINDYVSKGIVIERSSDDKIYYDYYNKIFKKMIYDGLDKEEKKERHKKIAILLEQEINPNIEEYSEELIYHLEKAGERDKLFRYCMINADSLEKRHIRKAAIEYLEKVISLYDESHEDKKEAEIFLKLGDLYRRDGLVDDGIKYYTCCSELADKFGTEDIKITALGRIAAIYLNKGEVKRCEKYISIAEEALRNTCYLEGLLEVNLLKVKLLSLRRRYNEAFDICDNSLKICDENHAKYRGRLLKAKGNLNFYNGCVDEALRDYEESIRYYEKAGYLKGTLNPLNSIGVIWGDYFQDDEKSLKYFLKLKEISEKNCFLESDIVAITNIGENHFYNQQYDDALDCFMRAADKAERFSMEGDLFYNYVFIVYTYIKLQDFRNAERYYSMANEELEAHPEQGYTMREYYRVGGMLYYKYGQLDKAYNYINKSIDLYKNDTSIGQWDAQLIRNIIRIKLSKNLSEVGEILSDAKSILANVKRNTKKSEAALEMALALHIGGYSEESLKFLRNYDSEFHGDNIIARKSYLEAVMLKGEPTYELLMKALEVSETYKDDEIRWRIYCAIGDYYYNRNNYFYAVNYYFQAAEFIKGFIESIPKEYQVSCFNFYGMREPFHKMLKIREVYENRNYDIGDLWQPISDKIQLKSVFKYEDIKNLLNNMQFIQSAQDIFDQGHGDIMKSVDDILCNICSEPIYNLGLIVKYLARVALAKEVYVLMEDLNGDINILASEKPAAGDFVNRFILESVKASRKPLLITDNILDQDEYRFDIIHANNKVIMCLPVIMNKNLNTINIVEDRRVNKVGVNQVLGYVYLEAQRLLNNFNNDTLNLCTRLTPLVGLNIEKYQLKLSASIDILTKTLTRKFLDDTLQEQRHASEINGTSFSIIMFDLDNFKQINDKFGHVTGDTVLAKVCSIVLNNIRQRDGCGRYGGEEFIVVLPDTSLDGAALVAEKLRKRVEESKILGDKQEVTISIGISNYPSQSTTIKELVEKADQALYVAKNLGKNRYQVWNEEFKGKVNVSNKLTGIINGNAVQDYRNASAIVELIDLVKNQASVEEKIYNFLGRIIEITEAQQGCFLIVKEDMVVNMYSRKTFEEGWVESICNDNIISDVITSQKGTYLIDWDEVYDYDIIKGIPDWKSIAVAPVISNQKVKAVVSLSVSAKVKEFRFDDFNFITVLAQLAEGILP